MRPLAMLTLTTSLAALTGGCLEARRAGGTTDATTADGDATADATDAADATCSAQSCDDDNPCTVDWCDEATGSCRHDAVPQPVAPSEPPECDHDSQCDDGDLCTADRCASVSERCGGRPWAYCEHVPIDGCGEPPTGCDSQGISPVSDVLYNAGGAGRFKVAGRISPHHDAVCDDPEACVCEALPAVWDASGASLGLIDGTGDGAPWGCRIVGCDEAEVSCAPLMAGGYYWIWGQAVPEYFGTPGAAPTPSPGDGGRQGRGDAAVPQLLSSLEVAGFCLQTNALGLPGRYVGTVHYEGSGDLDFDVEARIRASDDGLRLTWARSCVDCTGSGDGLDVQDVPVVAGEGAVSFDVDLPGRLGDLWPVAVVLTSNRNRLEGGFVVEWSRGGAGDQPWEPRGTVTLERVGD